jgi:hypothetical protein
MDRITGIRTISGSMLEREEETEGLRVTSIGAQKIFFV